MTSLLEPKPSERKVIDMHVNVYLDANQLDSDRLGYAFTVSQAIREEIIDFVRGRLSEYDDIPLRFETY